MVSIPADTHRPRIYHAGRRHCATLMIAVALAGCVSTKAPRLDDSGASVRGVYPVTTDNIEAVRARTLATINEARSANGLAPVSMDAMLNRAADVHSADMSRQKRAWHFGSDGSSPMDRVARAGFRGSLVGEVVSQTYESEVKAVKAWMNSPPQRAILLSPEAGRIGIGVYQEEDMKLWWTITVAR